MLNIQALSEKARITMELTKDELQVLSAYLDCNPCEAGCAIEEMNPGEGKDCDKCKFEELSWKLRVKVWKEMEDGNSRSN
jgi:hypothetical protein